MVDIFNQYEKESSPRQPRAYSDSSQKYGFFVRLVMKLSGGSVTDPTQANKVLLVAAILIIIISVVIFWFGFGGSSVPISPPEAT